MARSAVFLAIKGEGAGHVLHDLDLLAPRDAIASRTAVLLDLPCVCLNPYSTCLTTTPLTQLCIFGSAAVGLYRAIASAFTFDRVEQSVHHLRRVFEKELHGKL